MHLHILGICGTFMGGVAALARAAGHRVTGSDADAWPPMSTQLEALGIEVAKGWDPAVLDSAPDCVAVGNVMSRGNPLVEAMLDRGLPYTSGPAWLAAHVLAGRRVAAVAGTHGKTTTASLLAWMLESAGRSPGFLIGGVPANFGRSARFGDGDVFVVEADEYDTAFFDKRAKFVHYRPGVAVLNNLEYDHADIYPDLAAIEWQFHQLVRTVPGTGRLIVNAGDRNLAALLERGCWTPVETFAAGGGDDGAFWRLRREEGGVALERGGERIATGEWTLPGSHNLENAAAAIGAAVALGVEPHAALAALAEFSGVRRRLELAGRFARDGGEIRVYDDFAHHPTAIARTLDGLSGAEGRLLVALEPRSNTMKLGVHRDTLAASLDAADRVFVYRDPALEWDLSGALEPLGARLMLADDHDALLSALAAEIAPGDRVVFMSNGGFGGLCARLTEILGEEP